MILLSEQQQVDEFSAIATVATVELVSVELPPGDPTRIKFPCLARKTLSLEGDVWPCVQIYLHLLVNIKF